MEEIVIEDLWWKYQQKPDWILKGINLSVKKGEFLAITGPSDAGKTTLCRCLVGLVPHSYKGEMKGKVQILGRDTKDSRVSDLSKVIGLVFDDPENQFIGMQVSDEITFGLENMVLPREEIQRRMDWALRVVRMEGSYEKRSYDLSGGQKQRISLASVLAMQPRIIVLDEPTSELDPIGKMEIFSVLGELKKKVDVTIILVEHNVEEIVKYADRVVLIHDGQIKLDAPPRDFFGKIDFLKDYGVWVPQVTEATYLCSKKGGEGFAAKVPLSLSEATAMLKEMKNMGE
jgi:energy-coupling factor transport system ATP-binding protein